MALKHANDETFESMIGDGLTLVDFWATWCGPCQMFGPIFESVSDAEKDVNFVKFEIIGCPPLLPKEKSTSINGYITTTNGNKLFKYLASSGFSCFMISLI